MDEPTLAVEAPFQHDGVQMGMEPRELPRRSIGDDRCTVEPAAGSDVVEPLDHRVHLSSISPYSVLC